jgi:hypothetical protein
VSPVDIAGSDAIRVRLNALVAARGITLTDLASPVGITPVYPSVLKNGRQSHPLVHPGGTVPRAGPPAG